MRIADCLGNIRLLGVRIFRFLCAFRSLALIGLLPFRQVFFWYFVAFRNFAVAVCLDTGVSSEYLVKSFIEGVSESDVFTEGYEHLLQQRELCSLGALHVYRLHVKQPAANGQCKQITLQNRGVTAVKQVQSL